jgi:hypothetical protein
MAISTGEAGSRFFDLFGVQCATTRPPMTAMSIGLEFSDLSRLVIRKFKD